MNNKEKKLIKKQIETAESTEEILEIINNIVEVKEKRIQELEEENATLRKANNITKDIAKEVKIEDITQVMDKSFEEFMKDYISKQEVKNKLEELKKEYGIALEENSTKAFILKCQIDILEELLKGEK